MSVLTLGAARAAIIVVAGAGALALATLPSAAHAAEVVTCTQAATPETQPWLTFAAAGNAIAPFSAAIDTYVGATQNLPASLPASFTEADLATYNAQFDAAEVALQATTSQGGQNPLGPLADQLNQADPENSTGWQEKLDALEDQFQTEVSPYGADLFLALGSYSTALYTFETEADAVVDADVPAGGPYERPVLPTNLISDGAAIVSAYAGVAGLFQSIYLDGAATNVVYVETCVTTTVPDAGVTAAVAPAKTLAATGTSDGIALGSASALLLVTGMASVLVVRRRSA